MRELHGAGLELPDEIECVAMGQVALDPKSLSIISQIVTERIEKEFSLRDGQLLDQVRALLQQQAHQPLTLPAIANPGPGLGPGLQPHPNPSSRRREGVGQEDGGLPPVNVPKRQSPYLKAVRKDADREADRDGDKSGAEGGSLKGQSLRITRF